MEERTLFRFLLLLFDMNPVRLEVLFEKKMCHGTSIDLTYIRCDWVQLAMTIVMDLEKRVVQKSNKSYFVPKMSKT